MTYSDNQTGQTEEFIEAPSTPTGVTIWSYDYNEEYNDVEEPLVDTVGTVDTSRLVSTTLITLWNDAGKDVADYYEYTLYRDCLLTSIREQSKFPRQ